MRAEVRAGTREAGGRGAVASRAACTGKVRFKAWGAGTREAHGEHGVHGYDVGRVKVQWLVERRRSLPNRRDGICEIPCW